METQTYLYDVLTLLGTKNYTENKGIRVLFCVK